MDTCLPRVIGPECREVSLLVDWVAARHSLDEMMPLAETLTPMGRRGRYLANAILAGVRGLADNKPEDPGKQEASNPEIPDKQEPQEPQKVNGTALNTMGLLDRIEASKEQKKLSRDLDAQVRACAKEFNEEYVGLDPNSPAFMPFVRPTTFHHDGEKTTVFFVGTANIPHSNERWHYAIGCHVDGKTRKKRNDEEGYIYETVGGDKAVIVTDLIKDINTRFMWAIVPKNEKTYFRFWCHDHEKKRDIPELYTYLEATATEIHSISKDDYYRAIHKLKGISDDGDLPF